MKVDFKKPRYILPLIILPFLLVFFHVYRGMAGTEAESIQGKDSLQFNVAGVSDQVKNSPLSGKLDAYRNRYKQSDGYTAIGQIQEEQALSMETGSLYNEREKRMLDSIDQALKNKYGRPASGVSMRNSSQTLPAQYQNRTAFEQDKTLAQALAKINQPAPVSSKSTAVDPMQLFRQQMALVDSMGKANDPDFKSAQQRKQQMELLAKEKSAEKALPVSKSLASSSTFNTITAQNDDSFITAIVDQNITGYSGSRLRIRLLEDMMAGPFLIKKGSYLYAHISGFSGQRVMLSIGSIMQDGHILPVKLTVYDNDGAPGLYVPASAFREFSKELGSSTTQGITLQQQAETNNQLVMGMLQKMFQSTTTAVGKLIRQNKAKLKYNTMVYLIDPEALKNKQNSY